MKFTPIKKAKFIQHLIEGKSVLASCGLVNISHVAAYNHRRTDPYFEKSWIEAIETYEAGLLQQMEAEADRRALEGDLRPVGFFKGKPSAAVREYSDSLLMFRMKKLDPRYRDNFRLDVSQTVNMPGPPGARMTDDQHAVVTELTIEQRRARLAALTPDDETH